MTKKILQESDCKKGFKLDLEKNACVRTPDPNPNREWVEKKNPQESMTKIFADTLIGFIVSLGIIITLQNTTVNVPILAFVVAFIDIGIVILLYVQMSKNSVTKTHLLKRFAIQLGVSFIISLVMVYIVGFSFTTTIPDFQIALVVWLIMYPQVILIDKIF